MPTPRDNETRDDFMERCMGDSEARNDFPEQDQRAAFCRSTWDRMHTNKARPNSTATSTELQRVQFNRAQGATLRREVFEGEEHVVAPVVAAVEGVLNGSFLPAEEMGRYVQSWNGIPVPVLHPEEAGQHVSANSPRVLEERTVGRFFNARMDGPKLKGEVWINVRKAEQVAPGLIEGMETGEMFEVSTAYFSDMLDTQGAHRGRDYRGTYVNLRPDHLALLPGEVGACSIADGCGCPRLNQREDTMDNDTPTEGERTPRTLAQAVGDTINSWFRANGKDSPVSVTVDGDTVDDGAPFQAELRATGTTTADPDPTPNAEEPEAPQVNAAKVLRALALRVQRALGGLVVNLSANQIMSQLTEQANQRFRQNPMQNIMVEDLLVDEQAAIIRMDRYGGPLDEDPWTLKRVPYTVSGDAVTLGEAAVEVVAVTEYRPITQEAPAEPVAQSKNRGGDQPGAFHSNGNQEVDMNRDAVIKGLIANQQAPFTEDDQSYLTELTDERLKSFAESFNCDCQTGEVTAASEDPEPQPAVTANTAEEFIDQAPGEMQEVLRDGLRLHRERREQLVEGIKANQANPYSDEELRAMTNDQLEKVSKLAGAGQADYSGRGGPRSTVQANADNDAAPEPLKVSDRIRGNQDKQAAS